MPRLFTAIEVSNDVGHELNQFFPKVNPIPVKNDKHITLRFIGNVTEAEACAIELELISINVEPFKLPVSGCQFFKPHGTRAIFVLNVEQTEVLNELHRLISNVLLHRGIRMEERKYVPHITLARINRPDESLIEQLLDEGGRVSAELSVTGFVLYCSEQVPMPSYVKRREYVFSQSPSC